MRIDEQRTQPLPLIPPRLSRDDYSWLKKLVDLSGVRMLHVYRLYHGQHIRANDQVHLAQVLLMLAHGSNAHE